MLRVKRSLSNCHLTNGMRHWQRRCEGNCLVLVTSLASIEAGYALDNNGLLQVFLNTELLAQCLKRLQDFGAHWMTFIDVQIDHLWGIIREWIKKFSPILKYLVHFPVRWMIDEWDELFYRQIWGSCDTVSASILPHISI